MRGIAHWNRHSSKTFQYLLFNPAHNTMKSSLSWNILHGSNLFLDRNLNFTIHLITPLPLGTPRPIPLPARLAAPPRELPPLAIPLVPVALPLPVVLPPLPEPIVCLVAVDDGTELYLLEGFPLVGG